MATLKEELLNVLENLKEDEFKKFKWFLEQDDILEGFKGITVAHLENAGRQDTVDLMIQKHQDHGALQLTKKILEDISRNDLVQRLQNFQPGPKGKIKICKNSFTDCFVFVFLKYLLQAFIVPEGNVSWAHKVSAGQYQHNSTLDNHLKKNIQLLSVCPCCWMFRHQHRTC